MDKVEIKNDRLLKLIDHVGARGGLNVEEAHALGNIAACYVLRDDLIQRGIPLLTSRIQEENSKLMAVVDMIGKRGGLNEAELVMKHESI